MVDQILVILTAVTNTLTEQGYKGERMGRRMLLKTKK